MSTIRFYETFALFKIAGVVFNIYYRYKRGQTQDAASRLRRRVEYLARHAVRLAGL